MTTDDLDQKTDAELSEVEFIETKVRLAHYPLSPSYLVSKIGEVFGPACGEGREGLRQEFTQLKSRLREGYPSVNIYAPDGKVYATTIHTMVLETFRGPPPAGFEGCHEDGNRENNFLDNLHWDTHANNCADTVRHGRTCGGAKNRQAKLTDEGISRIFECCERGMTFTDIGVEFGVHRSTIAKVITGQRWRSEVALIRAKRAAK